MIIFRYLTREVLTNMFAVSIVLLLIIVSARFVGYLAEAATGKLDAGVLLTLMALRLPAYLELIFPLGLFIGILLAHGRLYVDSEMTVLSACGMSEWRLVSYTLIASLFVALLVGCFSLYLGPKGVQASETLLAQQRNRTDFETLKPARFHTLDGGSGISYAESMSEDKQQLNRVFMAKLSVEDADENLTVLTAQSGSTVVDEVTGQRYLQLKNGRRYVGKPGDVDYKIIDFEFFSQLLPAPDYDLAPRKATDGLSTLALLKADSAQASAALQWRFSLPVLVLVVGLLAVPFSRTQPRRGRYAKLLPAILIYLMYLVSVNAARGVKETSEFYLPGLLWYIHFGFFLLAIVLLSINKVRIRLKPAILAAGPHS